MFWYNDSWTLFYIIILSQQNLMFQQFMGVSKKWTIIIYI